MSKKRIVLLDRDGVINRKPAPHAYITNIDGFIFNPGIFEVLSKLHNEGFEFVVVTNQRGVARGFILESDLLEIHQYMKLGLNKRGISILDIFYCPHEESECNCRKPRTGMMDKILSKYQVDLSKSFMIGDSENDRQFCETLNLKFYPVRANYPEDFFKSYYGKKN